MLCYVINVMVRFILANFILINLQINVLKDVLLVFEVVRLHLQVIRYTV